MYKVFSENIVGYKNKIKGLGSQDRLTYEVYKQGCIGAVADGHSSEHFKFSHIGAEIACESSKKVLRKYRYENINKVLEDLRNNIIQSQIYSGWTASVRDHYLKNNVLAYKVDYMKYATTLITFLITNEFELYLYIGDGNIVKKENGVYTKLINKKSNTIVEALGKNSTSQDIIYHLEKRDSETYLSDVVIFTDGYENGFSSTRSLFNDIDNTIYKLRKNVFTNMQINKKFKIQLEDISKNKTKDDISIIFLSMDK